MSSQAPQLQLHCTVLVVIRVQCESEIPTYMYKQFTSTVTPLLQAGVEITGNRIC